MTTLRQPTATDHHEQAAHADDRGAPAARRRVRPPERSPLGGAAAEWDARMVRLTWWLVAAGVVLRLVRYAANRSLWLDEAFLAESTLTYGFRQLAGEPLLHWQAAPVGFLYLEKLPVVRWSLGGLVPIL